MTESWAKSQDRKRNAVSTIVCLSIYAFALFAIWLLGFSNIQDLSDYSGPIQIKIGSPEGVDESAFLSGQQDAAPLQELPPDEVQKDDAKPPVEDLADDTISENTIAVEKSPLPASPKPSASLKPSASPKASSSPKASASPRPILSPKPSVQIVKASANPSASPVGSPTASPGSATGGSTQAKPGQAVVKGSEQGNSYETNFEEGASVVGRGLYVPIYLYLPLPYYVDTDIYNSIKASSDGFTSAENRKAEFRKYYKVSEGDWRLKDTVPADDRPRLWILLSESGYKITEADYKAGKQLRPVVLQFQVGPQKGNAIPVLESVKILSSSGYSDIDDAVVYGFKKAAFFNNSPKSVTGRFSYEFD
jgi:outer membrane biosynthesis protein TonB